MNIIEYLQSKVELSEDLITRLNQLDNYQIDALYKALFGEYDILVTTGSPGSGKTTVLLLVKELAELLNYGLIVVAPYGTAANAIGGQTLGRVFNKNEHYLPMVNGKPNHYRKNEANRALIGNNEIETVRRMINSHKTVKIIMDEFSSFTSEELVAFKEVVKRASGSSKVSYLMYGQPLQTLAYDVVHSRQELNMATCPWLDAKFMVADKTIETVPTMLKSNDSWKVDYAVLEGMHRNAEDASYANCLRMLEAGKQVELTEEWKPLYTRFVNQSIHSVNDEDSTYVVPDTQIKFFNERVLKGKTLKSYSAYISYKGRKGYLENYNDHQIQLNGTWIDVPKVIIDYLDNTRQRPFQDLAVDLPYMSWVNDNRLNIQNGTKGIITNLGENSIEVDGQVWDYVEANNVPTIKGEQLFTYSALPGNLAVAMTARKVLGATIKGKVKYSLPKHSESGTVYVCCSRVTKAEDLTIYIWDEKKELSLEEMVARFNNTVKFDVNAVAFWHHIQNNISNISTPKQEVEPTNPTIKEETMINLDIEMVNKIYRDKPIKLQTKDLVIIDLKGQLLACGDLTKAGDYNIVYHCPIIPSDLVIEEQEEEVREWTYEVANTVIGDKQDKYSTETVIVTFNNTLSLYVKDISDLDSYDKIPHDRIRKNIESGKITIYLLMEEGEGFYETPTHLVEVMEEIKEESTPSWKVIECPKIVTYKNDYPRSIRLDGIELLSNSKDKFEYLTYEASLYSIWVVKNEVFYVIQKGNYEEVLPFIKEEYETRLQEGGKLTVFIVTSEEEINLDADQLEKSTSTYTATSEEVEEESITTEVEDSKVETEPLALSQTEETPVIEKKSKEVEKPIIKEVVKPEVNEEVAKLAKELETARKTISSWQSKATKYEQEVENQQYLINTLRDSLAKAEQTVLDLTKQVEAKDKELDQVYAEKSRLVEMNTEKAERLELITTSTLEVTKPVVKPEPKYTFTYLGKNIPTEFELSNDQRKALESLIEFAKGDDKLITLQGAAGTGKTSIIGYLQKYLDEKFLYSAPTHAATAELAASTVKTGNTKLPITVASLFKQNEDRTYSLSSKANLKLGRKGRMIVVDETSMIGIEEYNKFVSLSQKGYKIIFLGDKKQIPQVVQGVSVKYITPAFTKGTILNLDTIHRTSNEEIKAILQNVRDSHTFQLYKTENTENVQFFNKDREFILKLEETVKQDPQNTDYIGYSNISVSIMNKHIREDVFGRKGLLQVGDIVMGYLGYASKQIDRGNIANSIAYEVTKIERISNGYYITAKSDRLCKLYELGFKEAKPEATTTLYPLSNSEVFENDFNEDVYNKNNQIISSKFKDLYNAITNKNWSDMYSIEQEISEFFSGVDLMADYIYDCFEDIMIPRKSSKFETLKTKYGSNYRKFIVEKGIDFGHAITIHKSQGKTTKNVFFDASTLSDNYDVSILDHSNGKVIQINTERQALGYVAMSRASENLYVNEGWVDFKLI